MGKRPSKSAKLSVLAARCRVVEAELTKAKDLLAANGRVLVDLKRANKQADMAESHRRDEALLRNFVEVLDACQLPPTSIVVASALDLATNMVATYGVPIGHLKAVAEIIRKMWPLR